MIAQTRPFLLALLTLSALLAGCSEAPTRHDRPRSGETVNVIHYTVQRGDTLYSIAFRNGIDYKQLASQNGIQPPYRIRTGQKLTVVTRDKDLSISSDPAPVWVEGKFADSGRSEPDLSEDRPFNYGPAQTQPAKIHEPAERAPKKEIQTAKADTENDLPPLKSNFAWRWPTEGKVTQPFSPAKDKKGIDIGGKEGQPIQAAAGGEIVYSGNGLLGYGNLIIIKHDEDFLSAYGHNRNLLVRQGDKVKAGQKIAEMGQTAKDGSILHFEIRRDGKPVDPLRYLPK